MMEVWKFSLRLGQNILHAIPAGARPLTAQMQHGVPTLWALVDPTRFPEPREVFVIGTGHPLPRNSAVYVATMQDAGGFVWHVFDGGPR